MLFNSENYPVAFRVLAELGFAARTTNSRSTLPNFMGLFNLLLPKNQETYDYAVSPIYFFILNNFIVQVVPMFLETFQYFFPHGSAKIALNEYLNISSQTKWYYGQTVVLYK